jgi:hypothetical protein
MTTYFTKEHVWIQVDGDVATVGITDHVGSPGAPPTPTRRASGATSYPAR